MGLKVIGEPRGVRLLPLTASAAAIVPGDVISSASGFSHKGADAEQYEGIALEEAVGGAANGDNDVKVAREIDIETAVTDVTGVTDVGAAVFWEGGTTFTLDATATAGAIRVGVVDKHISGTTCIVHCVAHAWVLLSIADAS